MRPFIYDRKFKSKEETTPHMDWIWFTNLLPTFFGKEIIFLLELTVGQPIHLDMDVINKIRSSCSRVKIQVDPAKE